MIIIGTILCIFGLFVLAFSRRGRFIARGRFCRKCRFDLAGLEIETEQAKCPECGREIYLESSRRVVLRKRSQPGMIVASIALLVGLALLGFGIAGKGTVILGLLPDSTVFWLNDQGVDEALDELVIRVSRSSDPIALELHIRAIVDALAHQADTSQTWDPRWGEVLSVSFGNPVMTDEQMKQYIRNGMDIGVVIRDRVHQGSSSVAINHTMAYGRISALNFNSTGYMYTVKATSGGVVGEEPCPMGLNGGMTTNLSIPNSVNWMRRRTNGNIEPTGVGFDAEPGTSVLTFVEYELSIRGGLGVVGTYRTEQSVLVIHPDEAIVPILNDPTMAQALCESIVISHVRVLEEIPEQADNFGLSLLALKVKYDGLPASIALNVFIDIGNGELVKIGELVQHGPSETTGTRVSWGMKPYESRESTPYAEVIARMIELGRVDVIFETDAALADLNPGVDKVLELSIRFEDIPVAAFAEKDSIRFLSRSPSTQSYKADDPKTWYEGICEAEE